MKEYQLTNDRVNSFVSWVGILATVFSLIIALIGISIAYQSYRHQTRTKEMLQTIEDAKQYAREKRDELDRWSSIKNEG